VFDPCRDEEAGQCVQRPHVVTWYTLLLDPHRFDGGHNGLHGGHRPYVCSGGSSLSDHTFDLGHDLRRIGHVLHDQRHDCDIERIVAVGHGRCVPLTIV